jgi:hypothetical protein
MTYNGYFSSDESEEELYYPEEYWESDDNAPFSTPSFVHEPTYKITNDPSEIFTIPYDDVTICCSEPIFLDTKRIYKKWSFNRPKIIHVLKPKMIIIGVPKRLLSYTLKKVSESKRTNVFVKPL